MTWLTKFKRSAFWRPFSRVYQRSGLKARVYSRAIIPPVGTVTETELYARFNLTARTPREPEKFLPPIPVAAGPMPAEDAAFFARLMAALAPESVFEFGTNWGVSTATIAQNTPASTRIQTLDVCREMFSESHLQSDPELQMILRREHSGWQYHQHPELAAKVTQIFADSLTFEMGACAGRDTHDLILIDACHAYAFVKKDTENALKSLKPGGWIVWHDFYPDVSCWCDVFRYVSKFAKTHPGVVHVQGTHFAVWVRPKPGA